MAIQQQDFVSINALSNEDKSRVKKCIQALNDSMIRASSERDYQKESINDLTNALGIDKKILRRMAKTYHKSNFNEEVDSDNQFEEFYEGILK